MTFNSLPDSKLPNISWLPLTSIASVKTGTEVLVLFNGYVTVATYEGTYMGYNEIHDLFGDYLFDSKITGWSLASSNEALVADLKKKTHNFMHERKDPRRINYGIPNEEFMTGENARHKAAARLVKIRTNYGVVITVALTLAVLSAIVL